MEIIKTLLADIEALLGSHDMMLNVLIVILLICSAVEIIRSLKKKPREPQDDREKDVPDPKYW